MNCKQAKQIDLVDYIKKEGFTPQKIKGNQVWFLSPFRSEKTPSFKVDTIKNIWYDFGEGYGGTIIDFVMKIHQCNAKNALEILTSKSFSFQQQKRFEEKPKYQILSVQNITNYNLINYLKSRKINPQIAKHFCSEIHYTFDNHKCYYGIGFKNNSNGYEVRNQFFKGCLGNKDVTTFYRNLNTICLFESWSDFLSYLTLKKGMTNESFIILNSTAMVKRISSKINNFKNVKVFFDNDNSGNKAFNILQQKVDRNKLTDCRMHYKNHNDLNEYLISKTNCEKLHSRCGYVAQKK